MAFADLLAIRKNKTVCRVLLIVVPAVIVVAVIVGAAVAIQQKRDKASFSEDKRLDKVETVKVERGDLTPTLSATAAVKKAASFTISANERGTFEPKVQGNSHVKKGQVLGRVGSQEIKAPVDAVVTSACDNAVVPKNYPIFELSYTGFSFDVPAADFLSLVSNHDTLKAKFQIRGGVGPQDIAAVVLSSQDPSMLQCLISHESDVELGQSATVVVTAETRKDVMILPLSVVAGRVKSGMVTKVVDGKAEDKKVELGVTDGAYVEVTSGLEVGDKILSLPPNLDPREY